MQHSDSRWASPSVQPHKKSRQCTNPTNTTHHQPISKPKITITDSECVVIKVGSALISPDGNGCQSRYLLSIAAFITTLLDASVKVVLVSSGSVAAGRHYFKKNVSRHASSKKSMAAAGQALMMNAWTSLLDTPCAQLLLTQSDFQDHGRYLSIRETLVELTQNNVLPIVNENDAILSDEWKVGDNDNLASFVASSIEADYLLICTDIDGLYDKDPNECPDAIPVKVISQFTDRIWSMASGATNAQGTGGMKTKLEAASKAASRGVGIFIIDGTNQNTFNQLLCGENPGTYVPPSCDPLKEKQHWLTHATKARGEILVEASFQKRFESIKDLDLAFEDVIEVAGQFLPGDTVLVKTIEGAQLAKARTRCSSCTLDIMTQDEVDHSTLEPLLNSTCVAKSEDLAPITQRH